MKQLFQIALLLASANALHACATNRAKNPEGQDHAAQIASIDITMPAKSEMAKGVADSLSLYEFSIAAMRPSIADAAAASPCVEIPVSRGPFTASATMSVKLHSQCTYSYFIRLGTNDMAGQAFVPTYDDLMAISKDPSAARGSYIPLKGVLYYTTGQIAPTDMTGKSKIALALDLKATEAATQLGAQPKLPVGGDVDVSITTTLPHVPGADETELSFSSGKLLLYAQGVAGASDSLEVNGKSYRIYLDPKVSAAASRSIDGWRHLAGPTGKHLLSGCSGKGLVSTMTGHFPDPTDVFDIMKPIDLVCP